jgi:hypothetical protein
VELEILKYRDPTGADERPIGRAERLFPGQIIAFRVSNRTPRAGVYCTVLFVDDQYGVTCLYPDAGMRAKTARSCRRGNRLPPTFFVCGENR